MRNPEKSGFTLIELLVVIAIIALLLSIIVPSLSMAKQKACRVYCLNNLHQQYLAHGMYANDNNGKFVYHGDAAPEYARGNAPKSMWDQMHDSYITDGKILYCPALKSVKGMEEYYTNPEYIQGAYGGWNARDPVTGDAPFAMIMGYFWFPNFREGNWETGNKPVYKFRALNGEDVNTKPWPEKTMEASSQSVVSTHRLIFAGNNGISDDFGHLGSGRTYGVSANDFYEKVKAKDAPVGLGDGSSTYHTKSEIRPRAQLFGSWEVLY
jgi:prepilin-type N-terminal cleavage/methylation domain-containing protein